MHIGAPSPWGEVQSVEAIGADAVAVSTASHGGVRVTPDALSRIPPCLRSTPYSKGRWFEEDQDWAIPVVALNLPVGERLMAAALKTIGADPAYFRETELAQQLARVSRRLGKDDIPWRDGALRILGAFVAAQVAKEA